MWNLLRCYLSGRHEYGVGCEPGAIFLRCIHCGRRSSGWVVDSRDAHAHVATLAQGNVAPRPRPVPVPVAVPVATRPSQPVSPVGVPRLRVLSRPPAPVTSAAAAAAARVLPFERSAAR